MDGPVKDAIGDGWRESEMIEFLKDITAPVMILVVVLIIIYNTWGDVP